MRVAYCETCNLYKIGCITRPCCGRVMQPCCVCGGPMVNSPSHVVSLKQLWELIARIHMAYWGAPHHGLILEVVTEVQEIYGDIVNSLSVKACEGAVPVQRAIEGASDLLARGIKIGEKYEP